MPEEDTVKRCTKCGESKPESQFTRNAQAPDGLRYWCKDCERARRRAYKERNPELVRESNRKFRADHPGYARAWHLKHPGYFARYSSKKAAQRWWREHPEERRAARQKRRAVIRGATGSAERVSVQALIQRDGHRCGICLASLRGKPISVDHILPLSRGGAHTYANTRVVHLRCNVRRSNRGAAQLRLMG